MEKIKEAIKARNDRFNRLWLKAVGHTFEEDVEYCENEIKKWEEKVDARLSELGFKTWDEYNEFVTDNYHIYDDDVTDEERVELAKRRDSVLEDLRTKRPVSSLFLYDETVIDQAEKICEFLKTKNNDLKKAWNAYLTGGKMSSWDFVKKMQEDGFEDWDDGHSGNSGSAAVLFANTLIFRPELFPYLHGALATLVGDEGYHDDRSDIPNFNEKEEENETESDK